MKFSCKPCSYQTNRQIDITRHNLTKKHIKNVKQIKTEGRCQIPHLDVHDK